MKSFPKLKLERLTTPERIASTLRESIMRGDLEPGTALRESTLTESLGVSRNTIREAFRLLSQEGLVQHNAFHGVSVARITRKDVEEIYRLRLTLEPLGIAAIAAQPKLLKALSEAQQTFRQQAESKAWNPAFEADLMFHSTLVAALESPRLSEFFTSIMRELRLTHVLYKQFGDQGFPASVDPHQAVLKAVQDGQTVLAERHLREHLETSRALLVRLMQE